jgi:tetratricopeptide (TPR) repeat protein/predicted Ser/Thr protein kinase
VLRYAEFEVERTSVPSEQWSRVRALLERALEVEPGEREAWLVRECGSDAAVLAEVRELLAADATARGFDLPDHERVERELVGPNRPGRRIGAWQLERELGRGGMSVVWLAQRVDGFAQRAALKLLKRGMDSEDLVQRFERERAVLAALEHPGIARLYDGGTTDDGQPYMLMEYVEGEPLDVACAGLTLERKLELFVEVCEAVEYAHEHLVVHRDLKPSNILVTAEGQPKLLDFGIAKLLAGEAGAAAPTLTAPEQRFLTPQYASPEQLRGERVSTRGDVFSLGVVLFELLVGLRPFDAARKPDTEALAPSRATSKLAFAAELDTIVLKALQLEPARRYSSAHALADDLRRLLRGEPVLARPDTWSYRAAKFMRRNRGLVAAAGAVSLALLVGLVAAWSQYNEALEARRVADERLASVVKLSTSFSNRLGNRLANLAGVVAEREALLRETTAQLEQLRAQAPESRAVAIELAWARRELASTLGEPTRANAGKYAEAQSVTERALADFEPWFSAAPLDSELANPASALWVLLGDFHVRERRNEQARTALDRALEIARTARAAPGQERNEGLLVREAGALDKRILLARAEMARDEEQRLAAQSLELLEFSVQCYPQSSNFRYGLATALNHRAIAVAERGELAQAEADMLRAIELCEALQRDDPLNRTFAVALLAIRYQFGGVLAAAGRGAEALEQFQRAWEAKEEAVRLEPQDLAGRDSVLNFAYAVGASARQEGQFELAKRALERALECVDERMARRPEERSLALTRAAIGTELAALVADMGPWREALELANEALASGLSLEDDPARGRDWLYGMSLVYSNRAEVGIAAAADESCERTERRARLAAARDDMNTARRMLEDADSQGLLGEDERGHFKFLERVREEIAKLEALLPEG